MKTALLVEDDGDFRALLRAALKDRGFRTLEAAEGRDADAVLQREPVDVIIVDGFLPDGSGVDWIARLRGRDVNTPVLFMSAFFRDAKTFRRLTTDLRVSFVLYKPLDPGELARKADELVGATAPGPAKRAGDKPSFADSLAALRRDFGARLPAKVVELGVAVGAAQRNPALAAAARALAHRLRGTAGSYGYAAVGEAAGHLEDLLRKVSQEGTSLDPFFWSRVTAALEDTRLCAARPGVDGHRQDPVALTSRALLVVDDDPELLTLLREVGRRLAVSVLTAQTHVEALQIARGQPLLGALLDVHLERDGDSFALAKDVRKTPNNEAIPVAFMSIDRALETRLAAIEAGGTRFFEKPMPPDVFANLLQQFDTLAAEASGSVLVVDDDPVIVEEYSLHLRSAGIRVEAVTSADAVFERLDRGSPDLIILDVELPNVSGLDVCRAIRMSDRWELLPILIATAHGDAATRLEAFRAGASDVLIKPILPAELLARVQVQLDRARLVRERSEKDSLSGLLLRRPFLEAFQRSLSLATREGKPLSVALLDLDDFKRINDRYGHTAGDAVIAGLGSLLRRMFRVEDLRGRWGGEEFILAFPGQGAEVAGRLVTRLLEEFTALRFAAEEGRMVSASFSAGVATFPADGSSISMLIKCADERLYLSKKTGKGRVSIEMQAVAAPAPTVDSPRNEAAR